MKKTVVSLCMAGALAALSSCGSSKQAAVTAVLTGEWNIIEVSGSAVVPVPGQEFPYISFDPQSGRIFGNSGCNRLMSTYDPNAKPGVLAFGDVAGTRMLCSDMQLERNVLAALRQVRKFRKLDEKHVALCAGSKRPVMVLQKREAPLAFADLAGKWTIVEVCGQAIPKEMENRPFLEFNVAEKRLHGHAGCNLLNGGIRINEQNAAAIAFTQVACTMMACPDMEVESRVLKALGEVASFGRLPGGAVGLCNADGELVMLLEKSAD